MLCSALKIATVISLALPAFAQTRPNASAQPLLNRDSLVAEIAAIDLPPLSFSAESILRFDTAVQKLSADQLQHLADLITKLQEIDPQTPDLFRFIPVRTRALIRFRPKGSASPRWIELDKELHSPFPIIQQNAATEIASLHVERYEDAQRHGDTLPYDRSLERLAELTSKYPGNPAIAQIYRRRIEAAAPGEERDSLEQTLLTTFSNTPAAKQYEVRKCLADGPQPFSSPFTLPPDKPTLLHFFSPNFPAGQSHLPDLKSLTEKHPGQFTLLCIPVGPTTPEAARTALQKAGLPPSSLPTPANLDPQTLTPFLDAQGLTEADIPLTYLLTKDGTLSSIHHDPRLEKPLTRLFTP